MGRHCGWLTAQTAYDYRNRMKHRNFLPELLIQKERWDIDAIYIPEHDFDMQNEVDRLKKIMDEKDLPSDVVSKARNFKIRGSSGKLNIALDGLPTFTGLPKDSPLCLGEKHFSDSLTRMERAYDDWKNETWSKDPYVDMLIPTQVDPTMAPPGKHMMSVFVQYAPPKIDGREWRDEDKDGFAKSVIDQIANYSPDFKDLILHCEVRTPQDIENEVGLTEGNIFMGELTFDQLLFNLSLIHISEPTRPY